MLAIESDLREDVCCCQGLTQVLSLASEKPSLRGFRVRTPSSSVRCWLFQPGFVNLSLPWPQRGPCHLPQRDPCHLELYVPLLEFRCESTQRGEWLKWKTQRGLAVTHLFRHLKPFWKSSQPKGREMVLHFWGLHRGAWPSTELPADSGLRSWVVS